MSTARTPRRDRRCLVVGAGLAGAKTVEELRRQGFDGEVMLVGAESHEPYERPALSKDYLAGTTSRQSVFVHPHEWYIDNDVELLLGRSVVSLDRTSQRAVLDDGQAISYDRLLLSTGASPRTVPLPPGEGTDVHYLRTIDDSDTLRNLLASGAKLAVIGAGWVGLEVTAVARSMGTDVTVIGQEQLPLQGVLGSEVAHVFGGLHRSHGVDLRMGCRVSAITTGAARGPATVHLDDGTDVSADVVIGAVGARPNTDLAEDAGLAVSDGVLVSESLTTQDPHIFAAGDVARAFHPLLGAQVRVEHWANARKQPSVVAAAMLGRPAAYAELPYFFTDQFDLSVEYVGYAPPGEYDQVVIRVDVDELTFMAFWLRADQVVAAMSANIPDATDLFRTLIGSRGVVDPRSLADTQQPLEKIAAEH